MVGTRAIGGNLQSLAQRPTAITPRANEALRSRAPPRPASALGVTPPIAKTPAPPPGAQIPSATVPRVRAGRDVPRGETPDRSPRAKIPSATTPRLAAGRDAHDRPDAPPPHREPKSQAPQRRPQSPGVTPTTAQTPRAATEPPIQSATPAAQRVTLHHSKASGVDTSAVRPSGEIPSTLRPSSGASPG